MGPSRRRRTARARRTRARRRAAPPAGRNGRALDIAPRTPPAAMAHSSSRRRRRRSRGGGGGGAPPFAFDPDDADARTTRGSWTSSGARTDSVSRVRRLGGARVRELPAGAAARLLLAGDAGAGQASLAAALLQLERFPVHAVGLPSLWRTAGGRPRTVAVTEARRAARRCCSSRTCACGGQRLADARDALRALGGRARRPAAAAARHLRLRAEELDAEVAGVFGGGQVMRLEAPSAAARASYFEPIVAAAARRARRRRARGTRTSTKRRPRRTTPSRCWRADAGGESAAARRRRGAPRRPTRRPRLCSPRRPRAARACSFATSSRPAVQEAVERLHAPVSGGGAGVLGVRATPWTCHAPVARRQRLVPHRGRVPARRAAHRHRRQGVLGRARRERRRGARTRRRARRRRGARGPGRQLVSRARAG